MISIIYEDDDILAIDKPSGITVNRADTTKGEETVQEWAESKVQSSKFPLGFARGEQVQSYQQDKNVEEPGNVENQDERNSEEEFFNRAGIVHRLDKETSGILLIAKNPESFIELQRQFKERIIKKTYIALVHGKVIPREGEINVPVGRLPWNRRQFGVVAGGREALTEYKVTRSVILIPIQSGEGSHEALYSAAGDSHGRFKRPQNDKIKTEEMSLLELYPKTGRTHQIRVHLKYIGHPIFADFLYAGRKTQRNDRKILSRVFLHAKQISFIHPKNGEKMTLECPLPSELEKILNTLKVT
jgi:23S rRNA pseudouridine1911/1915/1917 synthase